MSRNARSGEIGEFDEISIHKSSRFYRMSKREESDKSDEYGKIGEFDEISPELKIS